MLLISIQASFGQSRLSFSALRAQLQHPAERTLKANPNANHVIDGTDDWATGGMARVGWSMHSMENCHSRLPSYFPKLSAAAFPLSTWAAIGPNVVAQLHDKVHMTIHSSKRVSRSRFSLDINKKITKWIIPFNASLSSECNRFKFYELARADVYNFQCTILLLPSPRQFLSYFLYE